MENRTSIRAIGGNARIERSDYPFLWSKTKTHNPYLTFINGTAGRAFPTLIEAVEYMNKRGFKFKNSESE